MATKKSGVRVKPYPFASLEFKTPYNDIHVKSTHKKVFFNSSSIRGPGLIVMSYLDGNGRRCLRIRTANCSMYQNACIIHSHTGVLVDNPQYAFLPASPKLLDRMAQSVWRGHLNTPIDQSYQSLKPWLKDFSMDFPFETLFFADPFSAIYRGKPGWCFYPFRDRSGVYFIKEFTPEGLEIGIVRVGKAVDDLHNRPRNYFYGNAATAKFHPNYREKINRGFRYEMAVVEVPLNEFSQRKTLELAVKQLEDRLIEFFEPRDNIIGVGDPFSSTIDFDEDPPF